MEARPYIARALGTRNRTVGKVSSMSARTALIVAIVYAVVLFLIPWETIRGEPFFDLSIYLEGFELGAYNYLEHLDGLFYLLSEPLWRYVIGSLSENLHSVPASFQLVSFTVSAVYAYVVLRMSRFAGVFLVSPLLIDLVLSQVRSAVAGALFFMAILAGNAFVWTLMLVLASLVHSSALLLFALYAVSVALRRLSERNSTAAKALAVFLSVFIPILFAITYVSILSAVGDRRAESEATWPGGAFVLTFFIYFAAMLANLHYVMQRSITIFALIVSGLFIVLAAFEINMLRLISLTYPALVISIFFLPYWYRLLLITSLLVMCLYHLVLWL